MNYVPDIKGKFENCAALSASSSHRALYLMTQFFRSFISIPYVLSALYACFKKPLIYNSPQFGAFFCRAPLKLFFSLKVDRILKDPSMDAENVLDSKSGVSKLWTAGQLRPTHCLIMRGPAHNLKTLIR